MYDALWVDDNIDVVIVYAKQVVCLNDFQAFVHERCGVYSDLASHAPVGVLQGICHLDSLELLDWPVPEGTTRGCQDDAPQTILWQALDALEDGRVL